jgi:GNAT superfamily N-acetyltransferase
MSLTYRQNGGTLPGMVSTQMSESDAPTEAVRFEVVDPDEPEAARLRRAMEEEADGLYADREGSIHMVSASSDEMRAPGGAFLVATAGGDAIGCGGFKRLDDDTCEIKRMFLEPAWRGRGLSRPLLAAIEAAARDAGYRTARLDTGDRQPSAKRLYDTAGYREIPKYNGNTLARHWFERDL